MGEQGTHQQVLRASKEHERKEKIWFKVFQTSTVATSFQRENREPPHLDPQIQSFVKPKQPFLSLGTHIFTFLSCMDKKRNESNHFLITCSPHSVFQGSKLPNLFYYVCLAAFWLCSVRATISSSDAWPSAMRSRATFFFPSANDSLGKGRS